MNISKRESVGVTLDGLPGNSAELTVEMDVLVDADHENVDMNMLVSLTVLGEGTYMPVAVSRGATYLMGMTNYHVSFMFHYSAVGMNMKLVPHFESAWGIDNFHVQR